MDAQIDWNDYKVLLTLIREQSLMATAEKLDIHHATVLRKIKSLEESLGSVLFNRHSRGHTPTESALAILPKLEQMELTALEIEQVLEQCKDSIQGKLKITTPPGMTGAFRPLLQQFKSDHPQVQIDLVLTNKKLKLEMNESHISIRPGTPPTELDYISTRVGKIQYGLFATKSYLKGKRESEYQYIRTSNDFSHIPIIRWMCKNISDEKIIYTTNLFSDIASSVIGGFGVGPMLVREASQHKDLVLIGKTLSAWDNPLFLIYHKSLRESKKVQVFKKFFVSNF
ncbi:hypothetical protein A9Q84_15125 [Halobacteriovorax marinus]|uniref:HTH lysR-type domain-containing protein n=1 Tax=Halobacteriovorax marinus TaxID=97084 RepID=A0A1Y5F590_9BACT|nr:hypothetical protein A9Q84_15125 [Halobacteriovorax marinus]